MGKGSQIELDAILKQLGQCGKFHLLNCGVLLIPVFLTGMYSSVYVFEASDISYRCKVNQCETLNHSEWVANALPIIKGEPAKCVRYAASNASNAVTCSADEFDAAVQLKCDDIVYSDEDSAVRDFNLGCQDWKRALIGTIRNSGVFISMPLTGIISDRFGRKTALILSSLMCGVFGFSRSFSVNYMMMLIMEFFESALGAGINSTAFVLAMELVLPKGRLLASFIQYMVFSVGLVALPICAWWLHDWRQLLRAIYTPAILVLSFIWLLSESVRWLLSKGRNEEAAVILEKAAKMNGVDISEELKPLYQLEVKCDSDDAKKDEVAKTSTFKEVLQSRILLARVCVCSFLWITCSFVYNGLGINSVSLDGNKYINFSLVAFMDILGTILYLLVLDRFGRKKSLAVSFILSAGMCVALWSLPKDPKWLSLTIYLAGKLSIVVAYSVLYTYVSEVFPTSCRQSLFSLCSTVGRVGSILAPMTPLLNCCLYTGIMFTSMFLIPAVYNIMKALYSHNLPAICFGALTLVASGMVLILPETLNMPLPDTVEEAEKLAKGKKLFGKQRD